MPNSTNDPYAGLGVTIAPRSPAAANKEAASLADLREKYLDAERKRLDLERLRATPLPQAPKPAAVQARDMMLKARAQKLAESATAKEFSLPNLEQNAKKAFQTAQDLLKHPGFKAATGLPSPLEGGFGLFNIPGTRAGDYNTALKSAMAEAFVPAFESLKGAGAITEVEGQAALKGLANLGTGMSEDQFKRELQRYVDNIARGLQVARKQAAMGGSPFTYGDLQRERARRAGRK